MRSKLQSQIEYENRLISDLLLYAEDLRGEYTALRDMAMNAQTVARVRTAMTVEEAIEAMRRSEEFYAGNGISDATGRAASNLAMLDKIGIVWARGRLLRVRDMAEWMNLITDIEGKLPWRLRIYLRLRQEHRTQARGWVDSVRCKYAEAVADRDGVGEWIETRKTFWLWWGNIIDITAREAAKRGLLDRKRVRITEGKGAQIQ